MIEQGDGGGPLVCSSDGVQYELHGVTSFADGCAGAEKPSVNTKIFSYLDWIKDKTGLSKQKDRQQAKDNALY